MLDPYLGVHPSCDGYGLVHTFQPLGKFFVYPCQEFGFLFNGNVILIRCGYIGQPLSGRDLKSLSAQSEVKECVFFVSLDLAMGIETKMIFNLSLEGFNDDALGVDFDFGVQVEKAEVGVGVPDFRLSILK
ncbi:MAG: hypothetical protein IIB38_03270 [Candidatus Hydrogenedentes bacterium]|nr:hypothetical protein [Candidatus Hydrogenedentota bacterium]